jgi:lyso-ornithine lipid O-acyltransferase
LLPSIELRESPVVGWLAEAGGCVYVERRSRANIHNEVKNISSALDQGSNVVVFPEAKSTNGDFVHPFKKSLFVSAAGTQAEILPITINYLQINGQAVTSKNRDNVCWYGDQPFHQALWRLMSNFRTKIEVIIHPSLKLYTHEDRHQVALIAHESVQSKFVPLNR